MTDASPPLTPNNLPRPAQPLEKLALVIALGVIYATGYLFIQRHPIFSPTRLPLLKVDQSVGFSAGWIWAYESIYLLLPLAWLASTRDDIMRYAGGFLFISLIGFSCFVLFPVEGPRPHLSTVAGLYRLQTAVDTPLNSFPSMHVALATYSALVTLRFYRGPFRRMLVWVLPIWVLLIAYSTLATKQHYLIDVFAGMVVGWMGLAAACFRRPDQAAVSISGL